MSKPVAKPIASHLVEYAATRAELLSAIKSSRHKAVALKLALAEAREHKLAIDRLKTALIDLTNFLQKHLFTDASGITGSINSATAELDGAIEAAQALLNDLHALELSPNPAPQAPINTEAEASAAG